MTINQWQTGDDSGLAQIQKFRSSIIFRYGMTETTFAIFADVEAIAQQVANSEFDRFTYAA